MKTILVPTDFSEAATNAGEYAANLAKEIKAKLHLFHVFHVPIPPSIDVPVMIIPLDELQEQNDKQLSEIAEHLKAKTGVEITFEARMGMAVDEILEEESKYDLIVMGMQGASMLSELLMGSITTATLHKAKKPVLVVPENVKYKSPNKIVFACDYNKDTSAYALDLLKEFANTFNSKIHILNVKKEKQQIVLEEAAAGVQVEYKLSDTEHFYYFSESDDIVESINDFVRNKHADLIAIIPHHYKLIENLFHKSISKKMAFHTHVPLLSLPENK
jgi:nucleotide-binding universal stress UspA family protein